MNRIAVLLRTPAVSLSRFDHPPAAEHTDPDFEHSNADSINIVESGTFGICMNDQHYALEPGTVFVTSKGMGFTCTHDCEVPTDSCLSLAFSEHAIEDLRRADIPALRPPFAHVSRREQFLHHRLVSCVRGEEVKLDLLAGAFFESLAGTSVTHASPARGAQADLMRRIERAIEMAERDFARVLTLDDLARAADMSAFHFARVFRDLTGFPPHRYLTAVRLHHAARMLDGGASVSHTSAECGFGSLSHFINAFRKRYGMPPSDIKRGVRVPALRASLSAPTWTRA